MKVARPRVSLCVEHWVPPAGVRGASAPIVGDYQGWCVDEQCWAVASGVGGRPRRSGQDLSRRRRDLILLVSIDQEPQWWAALSTKAGTSRHTLSWLHPSLPMSRRPLQSRAYRGGSTLRGIVSPRLTLSSLSLFLFPLPSDTSSSSLRAFSISWIGVLIWTEFCEGDD